MGQASPAELTAIGFDTFRNALGLARMGISGAAAALLKAPAR